MNRARAQRLHLPRGKIGISRARDLSIKTYHALAWDKRERYIYIYVYIREVRDNSMKLAARRKRRRGALKRIDAIAHFLRAIFFAFTVERIAHKSEAIPISL